MFKKFLMGASITGAILSPVMTISAKVNSKTNHITKIDDTNSVGFLADPKNSKFANVTTIAQDAFNGLTIPDGFSFANNKIKYLEYNAFKGATFLGDFTLPDGIEFKGNNIFESATFNKNLTLPDSITDLKNYTFLDTEWNNGAFLTKLPDSLEILQSGTLEAEKWRSLIPLSKDFSLQNTKIKIIEDSQSDDLGTFHEYALPANFKLPSTIKYIGDEAFSDSNFSQLLNNGKLIIPNTGVVIHPQSGLNPQNSQYDQKIKFSKIDRFNSGEFLNDPTDPKFANVTTIEPWSFEQKTIPNDFIFPSTIKKLESSAFASAIFEGKFTLPEGIEFKGDTIFQGATFNENVTLPNSITDLKNKTFFLTKWNNGAFLTKLPDNLEILWGSTLNGLGDNLIPLADNFSLVNTNLIRIESLITIEGVKSDDIGALKGLKLPANFKLPTTIKYIGSGAFGDVDFSQLKNGKLIIPNVDIIIDVRSGLDSQNSQYDQKTKFSKIDKFNSDEFLKNPTDPKFANVTTIEPWSFENKIFHRNFIFPSTIKKLESYALAGATFDGEFTLPEGIEFKGEGIFQKATFNRDVTLPNSITDLKNKTFLGSIWNNGTFLTKLPNNLEILWGSTLYKGGDNLIPLADDFSLLNTNLIRIEKNYDYKMGALNGLKLPANFKLPATLKYIGEDAFKGVDFSNLDGEKLKIEIKQPIEIHNDSGLVFEGDSQNVIFEYSEEWEKIKNILKHFDQHIFNTLTFNTLTLNDKYLTNKSVQKQDVIDILLRKINEKEKLSKEEKIIIKNIFLTLNTTIETEIKIIIPLDEKNKKFFTVYGFTTQAQYDEDEKKLSNALHSEESIKIDIPNKSQITNEQVTKEQIYNSLIESGKINNLAEGPKTHLNKEDIELNTSKNAELIVTVVHHGKDVSFDIKGFKSNVSRQRS